MAPKWHFAVEVCGSVKWILKYHGGGSQDSSLEFYDQVVKVGGWVDLEPVLFSSRLVAK